MYQAHVEPALSSLADVAGHRHDDEQQHAEGVRDGREQPQILGGGEPRERQQRGDGDGDVGQVMFDHLDVLTGRAVDDQDADADDDGENTGQRTIEAERTQRAAPGRQGAASARRCEFVEQHCVS